jgi:outer membrane protein OmpA-like peptidoglycan-associated protein
MPYFFALLFWLLNSLSNPYADTKSGNAIQLYGACYDVVTGTDLKVKAFANFKSKRMKLGESNDAGRFSLLMPDSAWAICFEYDNFRPITLPVNIIGKVSQEAKFLVGVAMGSNDSLPLRPVHQLSLFFAVSDTLDVTYQLKPLKGGGLVEWDYRRGRHLTNFVIRDVRPGQYQLTASVTDGPLLLDEKVTLKGGLNFKEVRIRKPEGVETPVVADVRAPSKPVITSTAPPIPAKTVYFEQSRYELTEAATRSLDSLAQTLSVQPMTTVQITGYTDNVGERSLNMTLAEYRARMVANYLRRKGIPDTQLKVLWKGPDEAPASSEIEEKKVLKRKVEIQFLRP